VTDFHEYLDFAAQVAREAGRVIREGAQRPVDVYSKGLRDLLTDVDLAAERTIVDAIHAEYPDHDVLTEESAPDVRASRYQWVIDPLDGTGNFSRGYPCFSTSIALTLDDESIAGVVYDPLRDHLFAAARGGGATLNGQPIHVSAVERMLDTLVGMDWTRDEEKRARIVRILAALMPRCGTLRVCGSAALGVCYVGAGWWDAYWHLGLCSWDAAAGALIVREAGGRVTDLTGERWMPRAGPCVASNGHLHEDLIVLLNRG
jgi:myo-inositol-1(or 4)-monophosphatase